MSAVVERITRSTSTTRLPVPRDDIITLTSSDLTNLGMLDGIAYDANIVTVQTEPADALRRYYTPDFLDGLLPREVYPGVRHAEVKVALVNKDGVGQDLVKRSDVMRTGAVLTSAFTLVCAVGTALGGATLIHPLIATILLLGSGTIYVMSRIPR